MKQIWAMTTQDLELLFEAENTKVEMLEMAFGNTKTWVLEYFFGLGEYRLVIYLSD